MQQCIKILLFLILNEAQHVSGDTTPIIFFFFFFGGATARVGLGLL